MRFCYSSHCQATKAQTSLRKCTDSPVYLLFVYTKHGGDENSDQNSDLDTSYQDGRLKKEGFRGIHICDK